MLLLLVTLSSVLLAAVMTAIAWRLAYDERRRSDARVAALAADIHGDLAVHATRDAAPTAARSGQIGVTIGAGALVIAGVVAAVLLAPKPRVAAPADAVPSQVAAVAPAARTNGTAAARVPLELVALAHERDGDQLIVRGIVRNPASAPEVDKLTAVVFVFGQDGAFVGSGRAAIASPALVPGGESTFLVTVAGAGDVSRYRVSFRSDDAIVPHVDRRARPQEKG